MKKLNDIEVEFYEKVLDKAKKLNIKKFEIIEDGIRIFIDECHTIKMKYKSKKQIDISFNEYGICYFIISGYKWSEKETIKSISLYKSKNRKLFNEIDSFVSDVVSAIKFQEHLEKQKIFNKYFKD